MYIRNTAWMGSNNAHTALIIHSTCASSMLTTRVPGFLGFTDFVRVAFCVTERIKKTFSISTTSSLILTYCHYSFLPEGGE